MLTLLPALLLALSAGPADKAAFAKVCGACHATSLASDLMTRSEWRETIATMINSGAKGTEDEFARVRRYLAENLTRVNVNVADAAEIAPVLRISEAAAQTIVEYRTKHGSFENMEALGKVPGLSARIPAQRKGRIAFR